MAHVDVLCYSSFLIIMLDVNVTPRGNTSDSILIRKKLDWSPVFVPAHFITLQRRLRLRLQQALISPTQTSPAAPLRCSQGCTRLHILRKLRLNRQMVFGFLWGIVVFLWEVLTTILSISWNFVVTLVEALFALFHIR